MYTLKVNIRAKEERERREQERLAKEAYSKLQISNVGPIVRKKRGLNFHQPGAIIAQANQLRRKAKLEDLQKKIAATAAKTGIADAVKLASLTTNKAVEKQIIPTATSTTATKEIEDEEVPDIEWWDRLILRNKPMDEVILRLEQKIAKPEEIFEGITNLVEHPPIKKAPLAKDSFAQVPIFLTKKEQKKLRRQNRKNLELEKQEKIKLGLIPKPEPKLKRSNIMYALGDEAIVNPSMADQLAREQEEKRRQAHLEHNESKKLTPDEKRAKRLRKIQEDLSITGTRVSVFRILNMGLQSNKFKRVSEKAEELTMTGVVVLYKDINVVVVEGGPNQQRRFEHFMHKIRWSDDPITQKDNSEVPAGSNKCLLVWKGQVSQRSFRRFKVRPMNSENEARNFFKQSKVEHYWDLAFKMSILESIEDK